MDGDWAAGDRLDFDGLGDIEGPDSADCWSDTPLSISSFAVS